MARGVKGAVRVVSGAWAVAQVIVVARIRNVVPAEQSLGARVIMSPYGDYYQYNHASYPWAELYPHWYKGRLVTE